MTTTQRLQGLTAINAMFENAKASQRAAFLPYFPIGFPNYEQSLEAIEAMSNCGVDGFEIGIPFSDPIADGAVIQAATQKALENGITVKKCLEAVRTLRERGVTQPMMMMGYANPLFAYGAERFVQHAKEAGADGLIVPDLPVEEAHYFSQVCQEHGMALVFFLAPTSGEARMDLVAKSATGFIYVVSLTGITGARTDLPEDLAETIRRIRQRVSIPLVLGFGISQPEHAKRMNGLVDGFIVGSAIVRAAERGVSDVRDLTTSLRSALDSETIV